MGAPWWQRFPLMFLGGGLLIYGAYEYQQRGQDGQALMATGLILLGAWLAMEVIAWHQRMHEPHDDEHPGDR